MAQILQSLSSLEEFFADLVQDLLGLPADRVLIQDNQEGQPAINMNEDAVYVKVLPDPDEREVYKTRTREFHETKHEYTYTQRSQRTLQLYMVFYGPNCNELSLLFNEKLYFNNVQILLKQKYLSIVPDRTRGPIHLNEVKNGQWYNRSDLTIGLYNTVQVEETVPTFETIIVNTEVD